MWRKGARKQNSETGEYSPRCSTKQKNVEGNKQRREAKKQTELSLRLSVYRLLVLWVF